MTKFSDDRCEGTVSLNFTSVSGELDVGLIRNFERSLQGHLSNCLDGGVSMMHRILEVVNHEFTWRRSSNAVRPIVDKDDKPVVQFVTSSLKELMLRHCGCDHTSPTGCSKVLSRARGTTGIFLSCYAEGKVGKGIMSGMFKGRYLEEVSIEQALNNFAPEDADQGELTPPMGGKSDPEADWDRTNRIFVVDDKFRNVPLCTEMLRAIGEQNKIRGDALELVRWYWDVVPPARPTPARTVAVEQPQTSNKQAAKKTESKPQQASKPKTTPDVVTKYKNDLDRAGKLLMDFIEATKTFQCAHPNCPQDTCKGIKVGERSGSSALYCEGIGFGPRHIEKMTKELRLEHQTLRGLYKKAEEGKLVEHNAHKFLYPNLDAVISAYENNCSHKAQTPHGKGGSDKKKKGGSSK